MCPLFVKCYYLPLFGDMIMQHREYYGPSTMFSLFLLFGFGVCLFLFFWGEGSLKNTFYRLINSKVCF